MLTIRPEQILAFSAALRTEAALRIAKSLQEILRRKDSKELEALAFDTLGWASETGLYLEAHLAKLTQARVVLGEELKLEGQDPEALRRYLRHPGLLARQKVEELERQMEPFLSELLLPKI